MAYSLANSFAGESLLSSFNWFDGRDPTRGFVSYQNRANADAKGLFSVDEDTGVVRLGVDHTNTYSINEGRPSIRLESKESFNHGLFIADFLHMPPSQCGLWPAFWLYGNNWPNGGEIDIIEGINTAHQNSIAAHTTDGCTLESSSEEIFSGQKQQTDCNTGGGNVGCGFGSPANATSSYGDGFNAVNGGVYAVDWNQRNIKVWHFERGQIPSDIEAKQPDPTKWKAPVAVFGGSSCNVDSFFKDMRIVINTNFCGDWGDAVWGKTDQCNAFAPTCSEYVAKSPEAFANAFWDVRYIDTYQFLDDSTDVKPKLGISRAAFVVNVDPPANMTRPANMTVPPKISASGTFRTPTSTGTLSSGIAIPPTNESSAVQAPANPSKIGKYAYLGCFGSRTGFQTFSITKESKDMSLEMCVKLCDGKTFAGVFDGKCLCAEALDADSRAMGVEEGAVCNHPCPGNMDEYCGGLRERTAGMGNNSTMALEQPRFTNGTRMRYVRAPAGRISRRSLPSTNLLSVYGDVTDPIPPAEAAAPPPPMASGGTGTRPLPLVTATAYRTVYPLQSTATAYRTVYPLQPTAYRTVYPPQSAAAYKTVYSLQSGTVYRTVYSIQGTTVYRTVYPLQSRTMPSPTSGAMKSTKRKYGSKPKFTYRDMTTTTTRSPGPSSAAATRPTPSVVPANRPGSPVDAPKRPNSSSQAANIPESPSPAANNKKIPNPAANNPKIPGPAAQTQMPFSGAANVPVLPKAPTRRPKLPGVASKNPKGPVAFNPVPLSAVAENPAVFKSAAPAAQQMPGIVTVLIKDCTESGATAVPSPTTYAVPPQVSQVMAAGNRVSKPMEPEANSEMEPSVLGQVPQGSQNFGKPNSPGSPGSSRQSADPDDLESYEGPGGSEKAGNSASPGASGASTDPGMPGPLGSPDSSQGSGDLPTPEYSQIPEASIGAGNPPVSGASGNRESKGAEGPKETQSPVDTLGAAASRLHSPVLVAAAQGMRGATTLAATLCAAALAVAVVL